MIHTINRAGETLSLEVPNVVIVGDTAVDSSRVLSISKVPLNNKLKIVLRIGDDKTSSIFAAGVTLEEACKLVNDSRIWGPTGPPETSD